MENTQLPATEINAQDAQVTSPRVGVTKTFNKFWVGLGNNSAVIKSVLKQRYWWQKGASESMEDCDFVWTSWKKQKHVEKL